MTRPTIAEVYTRHRAAFILRTPFGILLPSDMAALVKSTARDAGVTPKEVRDWRLQDLIEKSRAKVQAMTPDQVDAMFKSQARSFARAEAGFGSDADEAAYREAHRLGDMKTLKRLDTEAAARVLAVERAMGVA